MKKYLTLSMLILFFGCKKETGVVLPTVQTNIPSAKNVTISGNHVLLLIFKGITISSNIWGFDSAHFDAADLNSAQITFITDSLQRECKRTGADLLITTDENLYRKASKKEMAIITTTSAWYTISYGNDHGGTGTAYVDSWFWQNSTPFFVFPTLLGNNSGGIIRVIFHEFGHTVGLNHVITTTDWMSSSSESYGYRGYYGNPVRDVFAKLVYEEDVVIKALQ